MEKIILALDSGNIDENAIRFACHLTRLTHSRLTGFFLEGQTVDTQILFALSEEKKLIESIVLTHETVDEQETFLTEESIRNFTDITEKEGVHAFVEFGNGAMTSDIIGKSRFADVLILNAATLVSGYEENIPSLFVKDILLAAECPVIISPEIFNGIDNIVFCYDGSKSSVFAMKQFTYLFPEFKYTRAKVIYLNKDDEFLEEDRQAVTEWLNYHYSDVEFVALEGNATEAFFNYLFLKRNDLVVMGAYGRGLLASPAEDQVHLFERFYRGANVTNIQGTGLGLHIVAKYAELMNGSITCESMVGKGTAMTAIFKLEKQPAEETETQVSPKI